MYDNTAAPPPVPWYPAPTYPPVPYPPPPYQLPAPPAHRHRWVPVLSLALSGVALLLSVLALAALGLGGGSSSTLTGQVAPRSSTAVLPGRDLGSALRHVMEQDGSDVSLMNCPDTPRLGQGVVTVCHGAMDGDDWAFVVYFENDQGVFTLQPL